MKVNIPKVTRPIRLSDYAPEFGEQVIEMWVNPPRKLRLAFADITDRARAERVQIAALAADEDALDQYTKDRSDPDKKKHQRDFAANVLAAHAEAKDLPDDEKAERLTAHFKHTAEIGEELNAWYAEMWSQGEDEWTAEDVKELAEAALDTDPGLWDFVQESSLDAMQEYRRRKKADSPGPQT